MGKLTKLEAAKYKSSADLRQRLGHLLIVDNSPTTRIVYMSAELDGIAIKELDSFETASPRHLALAIINEARELGAAAFVVIDHYPPASFVSFADADAATVTLRRSGQNANIPLLDYIIVSDEGWFSQTFQRGVAVPIR